MALQRATPFLAAIVGGALLSLLTIAGGCASGDDAAAARPAPYELVATGTPGSGIRVYQSKHYTLFTTLSDVERIGPILDTLETGYRAYLDRLGLAGLAEQRRMNAYVFQRRSEWEAFTRQRTGSASAVYLRLHRGGYSYGDSCAVVDQGDRDTRSILAHEGFHLFLTTRFIARPPPFIEEGLATTFESILDAEGVARADRVERSLERAARRVAADPRPLRRLLAMHAGDALQTSPADVEAFYAHAALFVAFLRDAERGQYRAGFQRMMADAAAGRLSSDDLRDAAPMVERYVGRSLEAIEPEFRAFARANTGDDDRMQP